MNSYDDDEYEIPLKDQRYFGAGLKRKRVQFVPAKSPSHAANNDAAPAPSSVSTADKYLQIVLGRSASSKESTTQQDSTAPVQDYEPGPAVLDEESKPKLCSICLRPLHDMNHESSISHQVCLPHSHPPSALDRQRKGLSIMESHGWDADGRAGLGAGGEGRLYPIQAVEKADRAGLGLEANLGNATSKTVPARQKMERLDAGKVRKRYAEERKKDQRMRNQFYRDDEIEKYLGPA